MNILIHSFVLVALAQPPEPMYYHRLGLSAQQELRLKAIARKYEPQMRAVGRGPFGSNEKPENSKTMLTKELHLFDRQQKEMDAVLTDEQRAHRQEIIGEPEQLGQGLIRSKEVYLNRGQHGLLVGIWLTNESEDEFAEVHLGVSNWNRAGRLSEHEEVKVQNLKAGETRRVPVYYAGKVSPHVDLRVEVLGAKVKQKRQ